MDIGCIRKAVFWVCSIVFLFDLKAQGSYLERFTATEVDGNVHLQWVLRAGGICQGIKIERSMDGLEFLEIGEIGGVCGNINSPQQYDFTDRNPFKNKTNQYRLVLGGIGHSEIVAVEIIELEQGYNLQPHPVFDASELHFSNPAREHFEIRIFSLEGDELARQVSNDNVFYLNRSWLIDFIPGYYIFNIGKPGKTAHIRGKLMIINW